MDGWFEFGAALTAFFLSHAIPVRPPVRPWLISGLGLRGYLVSYSALSVAVLVWLVGAAARAPHIGIIPPEPMLRWVPIVVMPIVCALAIAGLRANNPLSFGGMGHRKFDPKQPGVLAVSRHPILLAAALWAFAHLLVNGDLAHVILFGMMGGFAIIGMGILDRRKKREMGKAWQQAAAQTGVCDLRRLPSIHPLNWMVAAGLYGVLLLVHEGVIGLSPFPV